METKCEGCSCYVAPAVQGEVAKAESARGGQGMKDETARDRTASELIIHLLPFAGGAPGAPVARRKATILRNEPIFSRIDICWNMLGQLKASRRRLRRPWMATVGPRFGQKLTKNDQKRHENDVN